MKKLIFIFALISSIGIILTGCSSSDTKENLTKITVLLDWDPNTNHTGLYVADNLGYFANEGMSVEFIQSTDGNTVQMVGNRNADFGISYQEDVTMALTADIPLPIKTIAAINQHNTAGYAAPADRGILSPKDFAGKTYGAYGGGTIEEKILEHVVREDGGNPAEINIVNSQTTDFFTSINNGIDFSLVYQGWDVIIAAEKNIELNFFPLIDHGLDYYTPVIITDTNHVEIHPVKVQKFLNAVSKGYTYAAENPEEAANILTEAVPGLDKDLILKSQQFLSTQYIADSERWGVMQEETWQNFTDFLFKNKIITSTLDVSTAYTNEFLPK